MRGHENHRIRSSETKIGMIIKTYHFYTGVNGRFTSLSPKMGMLNIWLSRREFQYLFEFYVPFRWAKISVTFYRKPLISFTSNRESPIQQNGISHQQSGVAHQAKWVEHVWTTLLKVSDAARNIMCEARKKKLQLSVKNQKWLPMMFLNLPSGNQTWQVLIWFTENINYKWLMFKYQRVNHKKHNIWFQIQKKKHST